MSKRQESTPNASRTVGRSWVNDPRVTVALCLLVAAASVLALVAFFPSSSQVGSNNRRRTDHAVSAGREGMTSDSGIGGQQEKQADDSGVPTSRSSGQADPQVLLGVWNRPGETYFLEIRRWHSDGTLEAVYFNPRPINVAKATWRRQGAGLQVTVELRDVGYPGSTYNLAYQPEHDILAGEYFQAGTGATYRVEFARVKR